MAENPSKSHNLESAVINCQRVRPTKTVEGVTAEGHPLSTQAPKPYEGTISRLRFDRERWKADLAGWLDNAPPNSVFVPGVLTFAEEARPFTTKDRVVVGHPAVAREKSTFAPSEIVVADFDFGDMPHDLRDVIERERLFSVLERVAPAFRGVGLVARPSTSAYIHDQRTGGRTGFRGAHLFSRVRDPADWPRAALALDQRLKLAGFAYPHVTKAGRVVVKSPIDVGASTRPYGLIFVAAAIFTSAEVGYEPGKRKAHVREGGVLDTKLIEDLSSDEAEQLKEMEARLRAANAPRAAEIAKAYREKNPRATISEDRTCPGDKHPRLHIYGDAEIHLDDKRIVTVLDIILNPTEFHKETCADPEERDYGGGENVAIIYTDSDEPRIFSQAHSGQNFMLRLRAADVIRAIKEGR